MPDDKTLTRRDLIATTAKAAAVAAIVQPTLAQPAKPTSLARPVAVASRNGLAAVKLAVERMLAGAAPVNAAVAGVAIPEGDPDEVGVGYGGLPNEDGVVQLDAAVMDGTTMRAGAVAALERVKHPAAVALEVMRHTNRILLVGEGALKFARAYGFPEENLLTERSRKIWLLWKENASGKDDWLPDAKEVEDPDIRWFIERYGDSYFRPGGTIHPSACAADGQLGCCTTTSGLFFKVSGRVGDSPLVGCGLYCDSEVGSAGGTGHGESGTSSPSVPIPWSSSCVRASLPRPRASRRWSGSRATRGSPTSRTRRAARRTTSTCTRSTGQGKGGERRDLGDCEVPVRRLPRGVRAPAPGLRLPVQTWKGMRHEASERQ